MFYLGIDAGASATKWSLINESDVVATGLQEALDGHIYRNTSRDRMNKILGEIEESISGKSISRIYLGITGVVRDGSIEKILRDKFTAEAIVVSDIELAYRANFTDGAGILLYAGTGSVAFAIDEKGEVQKIGGWGYLLGDEGAGYWIGREAIRYVLNALESKMEFTKSTFVQLVLDKLQICDWDGIKTFVYSSDRSKIAALSKVVDTAADAGDREAIEILHKAAEHLARLVKRIDNNLSLNSLPVKFTGGVSSSKILYREMEKFLGMRITISTVDISLRAAELAREDLHASSN